MGSMIINNQTLFPSGTVRIPDETGNLAIAYESILKTGPSALPQTVKELSDVAGVSLVRDFIRTRPGSKPPPIYFMHNSKSEADANHAANMQFAKKHEYPPQEKCIICGGGPSVTRDEIEGLRGEYCIISVSRTQNIIPGDYYIGSDFLPHDELNRQTSYSNTVAHLMTTCDRGVALLPWKTVTFGASGFLECEADIPRYHNHGSVSCFALEFACNVLKAKKIIMVGMEHPVNEAGNYYWHGLELQSMCWFACANGIDVWNCTPVSTVTNGVKLSTLKEATQSLGGF